MNTCCICKKCVRHGSMFRVPVNEERRRLWNESCGFTLPQKGKVCEQHFSPSDFIELPRKNHKARLFPRAVPSVTYPLQHAAELIALHRRGITIAIKTPAQCSGATVSAPTAAPMKPQLPTPPPVPPALGHQCGTMTTTANPAATQCNSCMTYVVENMQLKRRLQEIEAEKATIVKKEENTENEDVTILARAIVKTEQLFDNEEAILGD